jgi:serine/threonine protein kinase
MSPEQVRGKACTPASDVYALGLVLYEMLTSQSPLAKPNPAITLTRQLFTIPTPMRDAFPDLGIPEALDAIVLAMLAKDAAARPSAERVKEALEAITRA